MSKSKEEYKENRGDKNPKNMMNMSSRLFETIDRYEISKMFLAKKLYFKDWDDNDPKQKHRLTIKLRNKLNGTGKLEKKELVEIQSILMEMADTIKNNVAISIVEMERKDKIEKLMAHFGDMDDDQLDKLLKQV